MLSHPGKQIASPCSSRYGKNISLANQLSLFQNFYCFGTAEMLFQLMLDHAVIRSWTSGVVIDFCLNGSRRIFRRHAEHHSDQIVTRYILH